MQLGQLWVCSLRLLLPLEQRREACKCMRALEERSQVMINLNAGVERQALYGGPLSARSDVMHASAARHEWSQRKAGSR